MRNRKKKEPLRLRLLKRPLQGMLWLLTRLLTIFNHTLTADAGGSL